LTVEGQPLDFKLVGTLARTSETLQSVMSSHAIADEAESYSYVCLASGKGCDLS
jgi:hypothetical protein